MFDAEPDTEHPRRSLWTLATVGLLLTAVIIGTVMFWPGADPVESTVDATATQLPSPSVTSSSPSPSPSPTPPSPSPEPTMEEPTEAATTEAAPSPTEQVSEHPPCTTFLEGGPASLSQVEAALETAASERFWTTSQVSLSNDLVKAIAWMESGWQSDIVACDGGVGLMQVMPDTVDWMNQRFDRNFDRYDLTGNAMLGSALLQWQAKYFADAYFDGESGDYSLDPARCRTDPNIATHQERCLLNAVISGYHAGFGAVDDTLDADDGVHYPNHAYIETVRALMEQRPWL